MTAVQSVPDRVLQIVVPGIPQPQGAMRRNPYGHGMHDANERLGPWRDSVIHAARQAWGDQPKLLGPVEVVATFTFARLRSHYGTGRNAAVVKATAPLAHTARPDLDHLQRAVGDALTYAGVFRDDAQICTWNATKIYGETPELWLRLYTV